MTPKPSADELASHGLAQRLLDGTRQLDLTASKAINAALRRGSSDPLLHGAALWVAFNDRADLRLARSTPRYWALGLHELIQGGHLDAAGYAVRRMHGVLPRMAYLDNIAYVFRNLPAATTTGRDAFVDDRSSAVQTVRTAGADTVLLAFCGGKQQLGMPNNLLDRWFARLRCHVVYLRDDQRVGFTGGIATLGRDMETTIEGLRAIVEGLGARRVVCLGHSSGGTGALRYAKPLGADRVLALAPITGGREYTDKVLPHLPSDGELWWGDLVPLFRNGGGVRAHLVYGADNAGDSQQSGRMAGVPGVTLEALANCSSHHLMGELLRSGRLVEVLDWLVSLDDAQRAAQDVLREGSR
jgi:hypothetical protein